MHPHTHLSADRLHGRSLLTAADLTRPEFTFLVESAARLRRVDRRGFHGGLLAGRNLALVTERPCGWLRAAFEVAAHEEGAHVTCLGPGEIELAPGRQASDTARALGRMFDGIAYLGGEQQVARALHASAAVPVWTARSDAWRPVQMLADVLTMRDHCGLALDRIAVCYLGDGRGAAARSLLVTGALLGLDVRVCGPRQLWPAGRVREIAARLAAGSAASLTVTSEPGPALAGAHFVYADRWPPALAGLLRPYQVTTEVMAATGEPSASFLHGGGPAGDEVTDEVLDAASCAVTEQAENAMHAFKALLAATVPVLR